MSRGSKGSQRFGLAGAWHFAHKPRHRNERNDGGAGSAARTAVTLLADIFNKSRRGVNMKTAFWLAGATVLALAQPALAGDTIKIGFVSNLQRPDRGHRQRHAQLVRAGARPFGAARWAASRSR